jgi:hypothetical protein
MGWSEHEIPPLQPIPSRQILSVQLMELSAAVVFSLVLWAVLSLMIRDLSTRAIVEVVFLAFLGPIYRSRISQPTVARSGVSS